MRVVGFHAIPSNFSFSETSLYAEVMRLKRCAELEFGLSANPASSRLVARDCDGWLYLVEEGLLRVLEERRRHPIGVRGRNDVDG